MLAGKRIFTSQDGFGSHLRVGKFVFEIVGARIGFTFIRQLIERQRIFGTCQRGAVALADFCQRVLEALDICRQRFHMHRHHFGESSGKRGRGAIGGRETYFNGGVGSG